MVQTGSAPVPAVTGHIELRNVRFHYKEGEGVFDDFSLTVHPGETLALVGHTGSGKSSISKLVARFYEFQGGEILVDGHDIRSLDLASYRSHLGFVTQVPFLFNGSVLDNIRYGRGDADDAAVAAAAAQVGGGDWIGTLPDGLATEVTERGRNLSMGQRQLIALSRVLLQNPAVLILDEATASIDPLTEALVQEGMDELLRARTAIAIAHRLSTIKRADRIVVLRSGEIIEQGSHQDLLATGGHYAELYDAYFRHQEPGVRADRPRRPRGGRAGIAVSLVRCDTRLYSGRVTVLGRPMIAPRPDVPTMPRAASAGRRRLFTRKEYQAMGRAGILGEDERVEL